MKKLLLVVLSCCLIIGMCACGNKGDEAASDTVESSQIEDSNGEDNSEADDGQNVPKGTTFSLSSPDSVVRFFGEREQRDEGYASCNYPGSGFECKIKSAGGSVSVKATTMGECSFMIYVDGNLQKSTDGKDYFTIIGNRFITVEGVSAGEHTLKLIRITDFGIDAKLYSLIFDGEMLKADGTDEKRVFVEFIGDGSLSTVGATGFLNNVSVTYPYLVAEKLGVDYSITAYNGYGLTCTETTVSELYGGEDSGNFTRKADIAVINVGALDVLTTGVNAVTADKFTNAYKELVKKVKQINGPQCKIVLVCTSGNDEFRDAVSNVYASLGDENSGYYLIMLPTSSTVPPTATDHKSYAETIAKRLGEIKDQASKPLTSEQSGTGSFVSKDSDRWEVI